MNTTLRENIDWVGYVDWTVRDFHSYNTHRGTSYNAYLIRDQKTALIDTVKEPYGDQLLRNVSALIDPAQVDYVVCNHAEPDHAGELPRVMRSLPNATLLCDKKCRTVLSQHVDISSWKIQVVAEGDRISLGRRTLQFVETPMVHWPESMFTYVPEERLLFSMDAFGQHLATSPRFGDEVGLSTVMEEAKTYYANIVMPFGKPVAACLKKAATLDIDMIAPSHGVIWRKHVTDILDAYAGWAAGEVRPKVLVIYDSMWQSTAAMARAILEGASQPGIETQLIHVRSSDLTQIAAETLDAAAIAIGSATLNTQMMPMMAAALTYLRGLRPRGKAGFAFGSYGWGRGATEAIDAWLAEAQWDIVRQPIKVQYRPTPEMLEECRVAGELLAEKARSMANS